MGGSAECRQRQHSVHRHRLQNPSPPGGGAAGARSYTDICFMKMQQPQSQGTPIGPLGVLQALPAGRPNPRSPTMRQQSQAKFSGPRVSSKMNTLAPSASDSTQHRVASAGSSTHFSVVKKAEMLPLASRAPPAGGTTPSGSRRPGAAMLGVSGATGLSSVSGKSIRNGLRHADHRCRCACCGRRQQVPPAASHQTTPGWCSTLWCRWACTLTSCHVAQRQQGTQATRCKAAPRRSELPAQRGEAEQEWSAQRLT